MPPPYTASLVASLIAFGMMASAPAQAGIASSAAPAQTIELKFKDFTYRDDGYTSFSTYERKKDWWGRSYYDSENVGSAGSLSFSTKQPSIGSFASYCVELEQMTSSNWTSYRLAEFSQPVASGLAHLYQVANNSPTIFNSASGSAAFQAAVWEIVNEKSGTFSLSGGSFMGNFSNSFYVTDSTTQQANAWLSAVNSFSGPELYKAQKYVSASAQDLLVITAVPEPETYAMLLAGLGVMGVVARRRRPV